MSFAESEQVLDNSSYHVTATYCSPSTVVAND